MNYQKPELFLVGAAQGLVLGQDLGDWTDNVSIAGCAAQGSSRDTSVC